jgi:hypothetical protein
MGCFGILTYGVYLAAVAVAGFGLWFGLFAGSPVGLTLVRAALASAASSCGGTAPPQHHLQATRGYWMP